MGWDIRDGIFVPSTFILLHINTIGYLINIVRYTKSMAGILYVFKGCDILHRQPLNSTMSLGIIFQHIFFTTCTCMKYSNYVRKHFVLWYEQFFSRKLCPKTSKSSFLHFKWHIWLIFTTELNSIDQNYVLKWYHTWIWVKFFKQYFRNPVDGGHLGFMAVADVASPATKPNLFNGPICIHNYQHTLHTITRSVIGYVKVATPLYTPGAWYNS